MEAQIRGLNQAIRNASDGQSLIDTSEGAHAEVEFLLQRMRELAVQSANDTNVAADRKNLQAEVSQLIAEINRISSQTTWNGEAVLDGTFTSKQLQIGADYGQTLTFSVDSVASSSIGNHTATGSARAIAASANNTTAASDVTSQSLVITGDAAATVSLTASSSAKTAAALINAKTSTTGVVATAVTKVKINGLTVTDTGATQSFKIGTTQIAATVNTASDLRNMRDAINAKAGTTGVTAAMGATNADLILTDADGDDIVIDDFVSSSTSDGTENLVFTALSSDETASNSAVTLTQTISTTVSAAVDSVIIRGDIDLSSPRTFSLSGTAGTTTHHFTAGTVSSTYVTAVDISTASGAANAMKTIDGALEKISAARANLGAISNRLDSTVRNLTNVVTNVQASQGRIQDADFAAETTNLAKSQILQQAAMAMLAQANASKQGVLSLLQR